MTSQSLLIKDLPDFEQIIDFDKYTIGNLRANPKYIFSMEGEIFFKLITQHPGIFLQIQKDGEDTAGRAVYKEFSAIELVEKAAEVAKLSVAVLKDREWMYKVASELEAKEVARIAQELAKAED